MALLVGIPSAPVAAQYVIPPGQEAVVLEAVQEAFREERAEAIDIERNRVHARTADGLTLVGWRGVEVQVRAECEEECSPALRSHWDPVAARLRGTLAARADDIWQRGVGAEPARREDTLVPGQRPRRAMSYLLLALLAFGVLVAPRPWPAGSRRDATLALLLVLGFLIAALTLGDPRPLHDHLCNLERARCANAACDELHGAWGRPSFHVMGALFRAVPHRLSWILGIGALLTSVTLWLVYDVTARLSARVGLPDQRAGEAGLWALVSVALHLGVVRIAGTGSFWPLTLVLVFLALHLVLRISPPPRRANDAVEPLSRGAVARVALGVLGAGAAFTLALGGSRLVLVLTPLVFLAPWAWRSFPRRPLPLALVALVAGLAPLLSCAPPVYEVLTSDAYGAQSRFGDPLGSLHLLEDFAGGVVGPRFTSVLFMPLVLMAAISRRRLRALLPLVYAFAALRGATLSVVYPLTWETGYPDAYLKHFPQLFFAAPLFGIGAFVVVRYLGRFAPRLAPALAAVALVASVWAAPDARRLLFAHRVMERELIELTAAFETLPPHDLVVYAPLVPPPTGMSPDGDPLEMHFPTGPYREALTARGQQPGVVVRLESLASSEASDQRILLYVGSTLRSFYSAEIEAGLVPHNFEREELRALRDRYTLEPVHLFSVPTQSMGGIDRPLAAGRVPTVELGFYRLTPRQ
ncbi:MAG: hypothetical protein AB8I08_26555 [Sandaracinaceae bacterium]